MVEPEKYLENYPKPVSLKSSEKIIKQMKNYVCKINLKDGSKGTGFFCKIPFNNTFLTVLITNNHVIDENILEKEKKISISINGKDELIELENRKTYTNKVYDTTIIEIKNKDGIEIDDKILANISNDPYIKKSIYIIQYEGNEEEVSVSYGILKNIDKSNNYTFHHLCSTEKGSSGSPILNIKNNKIIGIHKEAYKNNSNRGTFLNYPIQEFINNILIEEFMNKYNIIIDKNIAILELTNKKIRDEGLKILCKMEFKELKNLVLYNNNISDIKILEKVKFENLKI